MDLADWFMWAGIVALPFLVNDFVQSGKKNARHR